MSITGGGGFGPKGPGSTRSSKGVSVRASDRRKAAEAEVKAEGEKPAAQDSFEIGGGQKVQRGAGTVSADPWNEANDSFPQFDRISQATDVVAAFAERNRLLTHQFEGFRQEAQGLVDEVARAGFAPEAVKAARGDLDALRGQMSQVRVRILRNNRRIKMMQSNAFNLPRYDSGKLRRMTGKLAQTSGDFRGGIGAVSMAGDVVQHRISEGQGVSRLPLGGGAAIDRHALGSYLSEIAPATMLSRFAVGLVEAGKRFEVKAEISADLRPLHADVSGGRAGRDLEELARYAELGGKGKL